MMENPLNLKTDYELLKEKIKESDLTEMERLSLVNGLLTGTDFYAVEKKCARRLLDDLTETQDKLDRVNRSWWQEFSIMQRFIFGCMLFGVAYLVAPSWWALFVLAVILLLFLW